VSKRRCRAGRQRCGGGRQRWKVKGEAADMLDSLFFAAAAAYAAVIKMFSAAVAS